MITYGETGDYFYIVKSGTFDILIKDKPSKSKAFSSVTDPSDAAGSE